VPEKPTSFICKENVSKVMKTIRQHNMNHQFLVPSKGIFLSKNKREVY